MGGMVERWQPVLGYEGCYEVSDHGRVRSLDRWTRCGPGDHGRKLQKGRILTPTISKRDGRRRVTLSVDNQKKLRVIAPMVLEAFAGPRPSPDIDGCHSDGNPANDVLSNLRWDTRRGNYDDSLRHGTNFRANQTHCKRGHELVAPNLAERQQGRSCRACLDTHYWARGRGVHKDDHRWLTEADRRYGLIVSGRYEKVPRAECVRGHLLEAPNLVAGVPGRICLTCSNTRAWAYYYDIPYDDRRWAAEADRRYTAIMAGEKAPVRGPDKQVCRRGHRLEAPNLRSGRARRCLACSGAQSWAYSRKIPPSDPRWATEADRRYAQIMAGVSG